MIERRLRSGLRDRVVGIFDDTAFVGILSLNRTNPPQEPYIMGDSVVEVDEGFLRPHPSGGDKMRSRTANRRPVSTKHEQ